MAIIAVLAAGCWGGGGGGDGANSTTAYCIVDKYCTGRGYNIVESMLGPVRKGGAPPAYDCLYVHYITM